MGESKERDGFFGKYTEHFDDNGNKIGESRERDGFFGKYTENTDAQGNKTGESRDRDGFFGSYTEHTDTSGNKTGESKDREGFFGTYTEHVDDQGNNTGESREREGFFGRYTEHTGSGWLGKTKDSNSEGVSTSSSGSGGSSGGYYPGGSSRTSSFGVGKFLFIIICIGLGIGIIRTLTKPSQNSPPRARELQQPTEQYIPKSTAMPVLKIPYNDYGACPFEGCTYGEWIAKDNLVILRDMKEASAIAFQVQKGEKVIAETGIVITTKPGISKVLRPIKIGKIEAKQGDLIYILTYMGEGVFKVWFAGSLIDGFEDIDGLTINKGTFEITRKLKYTWWVKIKNSKGKTGWSNQPDVFGNKDRFE